MKIYIFSLVALLGGLMEVMGELIVPQVTHGTLLVIVVILLVVQNGLPYLLGPRGDLDINSRTAVSNMLAIHTCGYLNGNLLNL